VTDTDPVEKILYTPTEAAKALGISRSTIYVLMASGDVPSVAHRHLPARAR
jgi:excisionase family DNA binding protein